MRLGLGLVLIPVVGRPTNNPDAPTLREQIAAAEEARDFDTSRRLKNQLAEAMLKAPGDREVLARAQAEVNQRIEQRNAQTMTSRPYAERIAEAQAAGNYDEAARLQGELAARTEHYQRDERARHNARRAAS